MYLSSITGTFVLTQQRLLLHCTLVCVFTHSSARLDDCSSAYERKHNRPSVRYFSLILLEQIYQVASTGLRQSESPRSLTTS
jgi:hypothetical protein